MALPRGARLFLRVSLLLKTDSEPAVTQRQSSICQFLADIEIRELESGIGETVHCLPDQACRGTQFRRGEVTIGRQITQAKGETNRPVIVLTKHQPVASESCVTEDAPTLQSLSAYPCASMS